MPRILISDKLPATAIDILRARGLEADYKPGLSPEEQAKIIGEYEGLIVRSATKLIGPVLEAAKKLKIVVRAGTGIDNIDKARATEMNIVVENTPGQNTVSTAEHAIALIMALMRNIPQGTASLKSGEWAKSKLEGREICGKTLGVLGMGNIGRVVADRAWGLKMNVIAFDPQMSSTAIRAMGVKAVSFDELLAQSDIITIHVPLFPATKGLINADTIGKMRNGVYIIHEARGGIVDEVALLQALESGKVAGAALDVFLEEPVQPGNALVAHPKVICTPHLGASTKEAQDNCSVAAAEQLAAYFLEGRIVNAVNADKIKR